MSLKLYYDLLSQPCRAVYIFLKVNNIPFEAKAIALRKDVQLTDDYKKINKFHTVPAIVDNDFKLMESIAILRYLSREKSVPDYWFPKDSRKQAEVDEYLEWQHHNTRFLCNFYFQRKYLMPLQSGKPTKEELVEESKDRLLQCLDKIENIWLSNRKFIAGDDISIADLLAICELEQTRITGFDPATNFPRIAEWMLRVKENTNPHYDDAHKLVYKLIQKNRK